MNYLRFILMALFVLSGCNQELDGREEHDVNTETSEAGQVADLTGHIVATSGPNQASAGVLSADGDVFYQAQGHRVVMLDAMAIKANEMTGGKARYDDVILDSTPLLTSAMKMKINGDFLWIAGGDFGLFRVPIAPDLGVPELVTLDAQERWCVDMTFVLFEGQTYVLSLWSGLDMSRLSIHELSGGHVASMPLDLVTGMPRASQVWSLGTSGQHAYVASGISGVVRIDWAELLVSGDAAIEPGPAAAGHRDDLIAALQGVRDIVIHNGRLYAAANAQGLIEVDLTDAWAPNMNTVTRLVGGSVVSRYPHRVAANSGPDGETLLAVGVGELPSPLTEWGPYANYANFDWHTLGIFPSVNVLDTRDTDYRKGINRLHLFQRANGTGLTQLAWKKADYGFHDGLRFGTMNVEVTPDDVWVFTQSPVAWHMSRSDRVLTHSQPARYLGGLGGYATGVQSKIDPSIILAGHDAGHHHVFRFDEDTQTLEKINTGSDDGILLGLWLTDSFITSPTTEWTIGGGAGEQWLLVRTEHTASGLNTSRWKIPVGLTLGDTGAVDAYGYDPRSYSTSAIDHDTGLVVMARSQAKEGIVITDTASLVSAAESVGITPGDPGSDIPEVIPTILDTLVLHHEAPNDGRHWHENEDHLYSFVPKFFRNQAGRKTLAIPAGTYVDSTSPDYRRSKIVFYDFEDFTPGQTPAHAIALGSRGPANAVDMDFVSHNGRQYMVVAESNGGLSLHDISALPEVLAGTASPRRLNAFDDWQMTARPMDGLKTLCSGVVIKQGQSSSGLQAWAACNRAGVFVVNLKEGRRGLKLAPTARRRINTPFQVLTLAPFSGQYADYLMGFDHGGGLFMMHTAGAERR